MKFVTAEQARAMPGDSDRLEIAVEAINGRIVARRDSGETTAIIGYHEDFMAIRALTVSELDTIKAALKDCGYEVTPCESERRLFRLAWKKERED